MRAEHMQRAENLQSSTIERNKSIQTLNPSELPSPKNDFCRFSVNEIMHVMCNIVMRGKCHASVLWCHFKKEYIK